MKILYVVHSFPPFHYRGTEVYTMELSRAMREFAEPHVFHLVNDPSAAGVTVEQADYEGVPVTRARLNLDPADFERYCFNPELDRVFSELLNSLGETVVHFIYFTGGLSLNLPKIARERSKVVITVTDYSGFCPRGQLIDRDGKPCRGPRGGVRCGWCLFGVSVIAGHHRFDRALRDHVPPALLGPWLQPGTRLLRRRLAAVKENLLAADKILYPNGFSILRYHTEDMKGNGDVIDYGIDTTPFATHKKTRSVTIRLAFIGQILPHKGLHVLAEAVKDLPGDWSLDIHGAIDDPGARAYYESIKLDPARAEFRGTFPLTEMNRVLEGIDILIVPSTWEENCPLIVKYALATGTTAVLSDQPGILANRRGLERVFFAEPGNSVALREEIIKAISSLKDSEIVARASRLRLGVTDIREHARDLMNIYKEIS